MLKFAFNESAYSLLTFGQRGNEKKLLEPGPLDCFVKSSNRYTIPTSRWMVVFVVLLSFFVNSRLIS